MPGDEKWLAGLIGKTRNVALQLLKGEDDESIAKQNVTSLGYVQKIKSRLRKQGFEIPPGRKNKLDDTLSSNVIRSNNAGVVLPPDGITAEVANKVYFDLRANVSNEQICLKYQLRALQLMALRWEWERMIGCEALAKLERRYCDQGPSLEELLEFMESQKKTPTSLIASFGNIEDLEKREADLSDKVEDKMNEFASFTDDNERLEAQNRTLREIREDEEAKLESMQEIKFTLENEINGTKAQLEGAKKSHEVYRKYLDDDRQQLQTFIRQEVLRNAKSILYDTSCLWSISLFSMIDAAQRNPIVRTRLLSIISNPNFLALQSQVDDFVETYKNILLRHYDELLVKLVDSSVPNIISRYDLAQQALKPLPPIVITTMNKTRAADVSPSANTSLEPVIAWPFNTVYFGCCSY